MMAAQVTTTARVAGSLTYRGPKEKKKRYCTEEGMTMSVRHSKRETIPYLSPTEIDDAMIKDGLSEDVALKKKNAPYTGLAI